MLYAIYFGHLVLVFYVMWLKPASDILFEFAPFVPPWAYFVGDLRSHVCAAGSPMKTVICSARRNAPGPAVVELMERSWRPLEAGLPIIRSSKQLSVHGTGSSLEVVA